MSENYVQLAPAFLRVVEVLCGIEFSTRRLHSEYIYFVKRWINFFVLRQKFQASEVHVDLA